MTAEVQREEKEADMLRALIIIEIARAIIKHYFPPATKETIQAAVAEVRAAFAAIPD